MVSTTVSHVAIGALLLATAFVLEEQLRRTLASKSVAVWDDDVELSGNSYSS